MLSRAGEPTAVVSFSQLAARLGTATGLCAVEGDPSRGLLVEADDDTLGSERVFRLDLAEGTVTLAARGAAPAASPDGRRLIVVPDRPPAAVRERRRHLGRTVVRARRPDDRSRPPALRLVARPAQPARRRSPRRTPASRLALARAGGDRPTAWSSPGTVLALVAGSRPSGGVLTRVAVATGEAQVVLRNLTTFSVR